VLPGLILIDWLGQNVRWHVIRRHVVDCDLPLVDMIPEVIKTDVEMRRPLTNLVDRHNGNRTAAVFKKLTVNFSNVAEYLLNLLRCISFSNAISGIAFGKA
jgi:hypothetical protein